VPPRFPVRNRFGVLLLQREQRRHADREHAGRGFGPGLCGNAEELPGRALGGGRCTRADGPSSEMNVTINPPFLPPGRSCRPAAPPAPSKSRLPGLARSLR
jgi:hypothetical protein